MSNSEQRKEDISSSPKEDLSVAKIEVKPEQPKDVKNAYVMVGKSSSLGFFTAAALSGAISRTIAAPFERIKILFQVEDLTEKVSNQGKKYNSIGQTFAKIYKEEGLYGYFKGNGTNVLRIIPINAIQFLTYEKYKNFFASLSLKTLGTKTLNTPFRLASGAAAGITQTLVTYPLDLIRCRLSAQHEVKRYNGIVSAFKIIFKEEGIIGLYRGMFPSLLGIAPYVAFNFTTFETLKRYTLEMTHKKELGVITKLALGGIAGTVSQTVTYPLETVRRRMQMASLGKTTGDGAGMIFVFKDIWKQFGFKGYFKGLVPNLLKVIPVVSVNFVAYEYLKKAMGLARSSKEL
jgi:solute carrier family 25 phosphate transporter 23/24/25/41